MTTADQFILKSTNMRLIMSCTTQMKTEDVPVCKGDFCSPVVMITPSTKDPYISQQVMNLCCLAKSPSIFKCIFHMVDEERTRPVGNCP